jgi:regulator of protease activity HflC (stomatin/prohibitin superfamily)
MDDGQKAFLALFLFGIVIVLLFTCIAIVPAGYVAVQNTFGNVADYPASSGFYIKSPFTAFVPMSIQTQEIKETAATPSNEGLIVTLDVSLLYKLEASKAPEVYRTVGENYADVVVIPQLRSAIREMTAGSSVKALYTSTGKEAISLAIEEKLRPVLAQRGIMLESILLRDLTLPESIKEAINQKLIAEQQIQQKEFEIQVATKEADRKVAEAQGIADSQAIIRNTLTPEYLTWYWISNLDNHESVIYIPIGSNGLPLFKQVD